MNRAAEVALRVRGVRKSYGEVVALRGIDLSVAAGEIVALVGANGAGKTTLLSTLAGLRRPDAGSVQVFGVDVLTERHRAQRLLGLAPQDVGVYTQLSVADNLRLFGELAGLRRASLRARMAEVAGWFSLGELMDRSAGALSGGQRRRLHLAMALLHSPRLVLLDEPTAGADTQSRNELLDLVQGLARRGHSVVYCTHQFSEVESLEARVVVLHRGAIVADGPVAELLTANRESAVELVFEGPAPAVPTPGWERRGSTLTVACDDPGTHCGQILSQLGTETSRLVSLEVRRPRLEDAYLALTGEQR